MLDNHDNWLYSDKLTLRDLVHTNILIDANVKFSWTLPMTLGKACAVGVVNAITAVFGFTYRKLSTDIYPLPHLVLQPVTFEQSVTTNLGRNTVMLHLVAFLIWHILLVQYLCIMLSANHERSFTSWPWNKEIGVFWYEYRLKKWFL